MDYSKLGELHSDIWWQHDKQQFLKLEKTTQKFLVELGFEKNKSNKASKLIKESYEEYDKALKTKNFKLMETKHKQAMIALGFSAKNGTNYSNWWIHFSQRNNLKIIISLWRYHWNFFQGIDKLLTPFATKLMVLAGLFGHNKRNKKLAKMFLSIYWTIILLQGKRKFILY
ncbi:MAG: hypothetical protein PHD05_00990 [Sphaerochaetaceae bacterium]|nr:hypothetical protein [Sphaerochaetaceae bacterium]